METILYTVHCTACDELQMMLDNKSIKYAINDNISDVIKIADENHITNAPILKVNSVVLDFDSASKWIKEQ